MPAKAVTFDLWDTLVIDDSDEPKRSAAGLPPKPRAREALFVELVERAHPELGEATIREAWEVSLAAFHHAWKIDYQTHGVRWRLQKGFEHLGIETPAGTEEVVQALETMEVLHPPDPAPAIHEALQALHGRYRLGVVSDAIMTPGRELRRILEAHDLLRYFDAFIFSDELGHSKPDIRVFHAAARELGTEPGQIIHIGDREENDVAGIQSVGGPAVLYTGIIDRGSAHTKAEATCPDHAHLAVVIDLLAKLP